MPRLLLIALGALGVIVVIVVLLIVTNGSSTPASSSNTSATNTLRARRAARANAVNPATVTVAVLNGTATNGLAHRIQQRLTGTGYKPGTAGNAPDQTHTSTVVAYLPGYKRDAMAVATSLRLPHTDVQPVDQGTQAVACPGSGPCNANVVVTVGADLSNS